MDLYREIAYDLENAMLRAETGEDAEDIVNQLANDIAQSLKNNDQDFDISKFLASVRAV